MKRTRIYTRTGDDGTTGLVGGSRIKKNAPRIEAYGTVDELSCALGVARAALQATCGSAPRAARLEAWLSWCQDALFDLGSRLATVDDSPARSVAGVRADDVQALERAIDEADGDLPPLSAFILPGGSPASASLQLARAVCRRAERLTISLNEREPISGEAARFLNRLSDALFVWARWINDELGITEAVWNQHSQPPP